MQKLLGPQAVEKEETIPSDDVSSFAETYSKADELLCQPKMSISTTELTTNNISLLGQKLIASSKNQEKLKPITLSNMSVLFLLLSGMICSLLPFIFGFWVNEIEFMPPISVAVLFFATEAFVWFYLVVIEGYSLSSASDNILSFALDFLKTSDLSKKILINFLNFFAKLSLILRHFCIFMMSFLITHSFFY